MASSSNSEFKCRYDIFLSFRGLDTRNKFTDHLYEALKREGFETFRDNEGIERGENINSELQKAIWNSSMSVIVLSKTYATSKSCLFEIQTILEHRKKKSDHVILPVFYEVEPSEIREQAKNLDFRGKKVKDWSAALKEVAKMKGFVYGNNRSEVEFIEEIIGALKSKQTDKHQWDLDENMQNLKRKVEYLSSQENDITYEIRSAERRPWKRPKKEVEFWIADVQRFKDNVQRLEQEVVGETNVSSCMRLGKDIAKKILEVQELQKKGRDFNSLMIDELPTGRLLIPPMTREPKNSISPNGEFKPSIKCWRKGDFIGRGSFGTVYEGFTDGGFFFAVKEVSLLDQGSQGKQSIFKLQQEISLLSQFEHENIVQYLGTDKDDSKLYIFLELVTKGSLANLYQKYQLWDSQVSAYTRQILNGLNYLHCRYVVHRDIKCANILVDASGSVKLADFGLAKATKLNDIKSSKGTAFWMAPEVVNMKNRGYGLAADIWSLGCTVLEMLTCKIPYSHLEMMQALFRIGKGELPLIPSSLSVDAQDFIYKCLQVIPDDRPTAAQLLDHPFVKRQLSSLSVPPSNGTRA